MTLWNESTPSAARTKSSTAADDTPIASGSARDSGSEARAGIEQASTANKAHDRFIFIRRALPT